jgi:hypothetical protein
MTVLVEPFQLVIATVFRHALTIYRHQPTGPLIAQKNLRAAAIARTAAATGRPITRITMASAQTDHPDQVEKEPHGSAHVATR